MIENVVWLYAERKSMFSSIGVRDMEETMVNKMSIFQNYRKT